MKKLTLRFFCFVAILYITSNFIHGFNSKSFTALLVFAFILAVAHFTLNPVIKFLTLPINFFTFGVFNFILSCILIYLFNLIVPGFTISDGSIDSLKSSAVQISSISLSKTGVIIISSALIAILDNIVGWANES